MFEGKSILQRKFNNILDTYLKCNSEEKSHCKLSSLFQQEKNILLTP